MPELDGRQIFGLVSLLAMLALWIAAWRNQRRWASWMKRKQRPSAPAQPPRKDHGGPWG